MNTVLYTGKFVSTQISITPSSMDAVYVLSTQNGMLLLEDVRSKGIKISSYKSSSLQLCSVIYATYHMSQFSLNCTPDTEEELQWIKMGNSMVCINRLRDSSLGDILVISVLSGESSVTYKQRMLSVVRQAIDSVDANALKVHQSKQLHNGISKGYVEMVDEICVASEDDSTGPVLPGRRIQLIVRCVLPFKPMIPALPLPHSIDFKFGGGLKPVVVSEFRPTQDGASRSPKLWHRKSKSSCWASIADAFFPRIPLKRNSVHPLPGENISDSRSALHTPQLLCQYLDYSTKCTGSELVSSSELVLEGHLGSQDLVRDVALALADCQQPSVAQQGLQLQHFVYHPVSHTLSRTSLPTSANIIPSQGESSEMGVSSSSSPTIQSQSNAEVRRATTATTVAATTGSLLTGANTSAPGSSKRNARASIAAIFKGGGYSGSGKRDCTPAAPVEEDIAAVDVALQKQLDVYYAPEQQLFIVCENISGFDALRSFKTDVFSTELRDFLSLAEKCLSERIVGHVRELPIDY